MLYPLIRNCLFKLDAECSHEWTLKFLAKTACFQREKVIPGTSVEVMGLKFFNRVGLAAGLDKQANCIDGLAQFGFGFLEVGTVTPRPQSGNPKPRLFRLPDKEAIINRFGFNSVGLDAFLKNFKRKKHQGIVGINIGKNRDTPIEKALDDYLIGLKAVYPYASYVTINISSPNTKNLRDLQEPDQLGHLLAGLKETQRQLNIMHEKYVPLAIKIAPDLDSEQVKLIAELLIKHNIDAVIATNASNQRKGIEDHPLSNEAGGLSGKPITAQSTAIVCELAACLQGRLPIIAAGGIMSLDNAQAKLQAGATLVQIYTGFIYHGPALVRQLAREL